MPLEPCPNPHLILDPPRPLLLVAAAALIAPDRRLLIAQRPEGKAMAGLWEFPGGKVEDGELPEQTLTRELQEELGIETHPQCFFPLSFASHSYDRFHLLMPLYTCRNWAGVPRGRESQAVKWVPVQQLRDYPMPPADAPLISALRDHLAG